MFKSAIIKLALGMIQSLVINQIGEVSIKNYLSSLLTPLQKTINVFLDKNPDNEGQLLEIWREYDEPIIDETLLTAALIIESRMEDKEQAQFLALVLRDFAAQNVTGGEPLDGSTLELDA